MVVGLDWSGNVRSFVLPSLEPCRIIWLFKKMLQFVTSEYSASSITGVWWKWERSWTTCFFVDDWCIGKEKCPVVPNSKIAWSAHPTFITLLIICSMNLICAEIIFLGGGWHTLKNWYLVKFYVFVPCHLKESSVLDRMTVLFCVPTMTGTREELCVDFGYFGMMIWSGHIPWTVLCLQLKQYYLNGLNYYFVLSQS